MRAARPRDPSGTGWLAFLRGLVARGLSGVQLVISDAHPGLVGAIASALPGASWQRCRTHYLRNLLTKIPRSAQPGVATLVCTIFDQADAAAVRAQFDRVVDTLAQRLVAAGFEEDVKLGLELDVSEVVAVRNETDPSGRTFTGWRASG